MGGDERRFDEEQVRSILDRAADRHERAERAAERAPESLSLAELEEVGREAGIDPAHVRTAAVELYGGSGGGEVSRGAGGRWHPVARRRAEGADLEAAWEGAVSALRSVYEVDGVVTRFADAREWRGPAAASDVDGVRLRAEEDAAGVTVTLEDDLEGLSRMPAAIGGGIAAFSLVLLLLYLVGGTPQMLEAAAWLVAVGVAVAGGGTLVVRIHAGRRRRMLQAAADGVELALRRAEEPPDAPRG